MDQLASTVPSARSVLKNAALKGSWVINDPFWGQASDRYLEAAIATRLGIRVPGTELLPNFEHVDGVVPESLRNRAAPIDWTGAAGRLGSPIILRPTRSGQGRTIVAWDIETLHDAWQRSGQDQLIAQTFVFPARYLRVLVAGHEALPVAWDPTSGSAAPADSADPAVAPAIEAALSISAALGQHLNAVDFAVREGTAYLVDAASPDLFFAATSLGAGFDWVVARTADLVTALASAPRPTYRWDALRPAPIAS
jgi:hypothetical protein